MFEGLPRRIVCVIFGLRGPMHSLYNVVIRWLQTLLTRPSKTKGGYGAIVLRKCNIVMRERSGYAAGTPGK